MNDDVQPLAKFIRLNNGDDVIADVIETEDEKGILYTLFHPLKVMYIPSERDGYLAIAFTPWVFPRICDQQEFVIHAEDVLMMADVGERMNTYYWENVDHQYNPEPLHVEEEPSSHEDDNMNRILDSLGLGEKKVYH